MGGRLAPAQRIIDMRHIVCFVCRMVDSILTALRLGGRFAPLRRSLIGDTTHYLQGAAVLTGLLYNVDSRARLAGSGAQGD